MTRWGMVIDLRKCIGCETCKHVCHDVNAVPPGATWRQVVTALLDGEKKGQQVFVTMGCMHCKTPSCTGVCPTGATKKREDGIVIVDSTLCVGCGSCVLACPYDARKITSEEKITHIDTSNRNKLNWQKDTKIGTCSKCNFCLSRVETGLGKGLQPGQDAEATPMCVRYCIADVLSFGDLDDPHSEVSRLIKESKTQRINEDLGTSPSVFYIID